MSRPPDSQLLSYLASYDPHISELTLALREMVLQEAPGAIESVSRGYAFAIGFSFTGKPLKDGFCHVVTYSTHVNLGFNRGALLPDPNGVLIGYRQGDSPYLNPQPERTGSSLRPAVHSSGNRTGRRSAH